MTSSKSQPHADYSQKTEIIAHSQAIQTRLQQETKGEDSDASHDFVGQHLPTL